MKKRNPFVISFWLLFTAVILFGVGTACTENTRVKNYGGKMRIDLQPNQKLVNATWKEDELWVLTRPMRVGETTEFYKFVEKSSYGIWEGEITFVENKN